MREHVDTRGRRTFVVATLAVMAVVAGACSSGSTAGSGSASEPASAAADATVDVGMRTRASSDDGQLVLETSSTRAADVSGGDVLVTVSGAGAAGAIAVTRDGTDVTDSMASTDGGWQGLVSGLADGDNRIEASDSDHRVSLTVTNHPTAGPVLAGAHLSPWVCTTDDQGLGPATDDDCSAPTRTTWSYRSTDGTTKDLPDPSVVPADVATATVDGRPVPFIVRAEQGVIDRGVAWVWVLDPHPSASGPWDDAGWNRRLIYRFGGGCGTQYSQGGLLLTKGGFDTDLLSRGYAVATNTLDTLQTACNPTLSAEAAMMTREHFVEHFGVPAFTIGDGGSGGAIQQLVIANTYPGLLDALAPSLPFPDAISIAGGVTDCGLLQDYFVVTGSSLTDDQKKAITGHASLGTCQMWASLFLPAVNPTQGCPAVPADQLYNATNNPTGVRCTLQDMNIAIVGKDPATGFARRPLDNTGVQYGLGALRSGAITAEEFVALNEGIGGYDIDGTIVGKRSSIDEATAAVSYQTGQVTGPGPLQDLPIIMRNPYTDELGDIHTRFQAFSVRARLATGGVDDPNLLLWTTPATGGDLIAALLGDSGTGDEPLYLLDQWITTAAATPADGRSTADMLAASRPAGAVNRCTLPDGRVLTGGWEIYDAGPCAEAYPVHGDPRLVAGEGIADDIVKCQLRPIDQADYPAPLTDDQHQRMAEVFPDGVCDWSKPGVGQQAPTATWQRYGS